MLSCKLDVLHIQTLSHPGLFGCSYGIHCMKQCFPVHNKKAMNRVKIEFDMRGLDLRGSIVPCMANCQLVESGTSSNSFCYQTLQILLAGYCLENGHLPFVHYAKSLERGYTYLQFSVCSE